MGWYARRRRPEPVEPGSPSPLGVAVSPPTPRFLPLLVLSTVAIAMLLVAALYTGGLWLAGFPSRHKDGEVSAATLFDMLRVVLLTVAGVGGVVALAISYLRQRTAEYHSHLDHADSHRSAARLFNERFAKASELIGSDKPAVRLAGAYAMAGLGDDSHLASQRQVCIDVLCAYLRVPFRRLRDHGPSEGDGLRSATQEREVRHTIIRLIGWHLAPATRPGWHGCTFDLSGADFDGGDLTGAQFGGGTTLLLRNAEFHDGTLDFGTAELCGGTVDLRGARFTGGTVDLSRSVSHSPQTRPIFDTRKDVAVPSKLLLPDSWRVAEAPAGH